MGPLGGVDLLFSCPQPDISLYCETMDTGLVHSGVCLFTFQLKLVLVLPTLEGWKAECTVHSVYRLSPTL